MSQDPLLSPVQAGTKVGYTTGALAQLRYLGTGPKFIKLSARVVRYRESDLDEWIESSDRTQTGRSPDAA